MKKGLKNVKAYVRDVAALILLTVAAVFLTLAHVSPATIIDTTNRERIF